MNYICNFSDDKTSFICRLNETIEHFDNNNYETLAPQDNTIPEYLTYDTVSTSVPEYIENNSYENYNNVNQDTIDNNRIYELPQMNDSFTYWRYDPETKSVNSCFYGTENGSKIADCPVETFYNMIPAGSTHVELLNVKNSNNEVVFSNILYDLYRHILVDINFNEVIINEELYGNIFRVITY